MKGAVSLNVLFTIVGAAAVSIVWIVSYVGMVVAPIKAEADINASQIQGVAVQMAEANTKLDFLLKVYDARYSPQTQTVIEQTTTKP